MNTAFIFCNKALVAGLQHLMCPPHASLHFLLRGKLNKHINIAGKERLNTSHMFTGLPTSFVTWFLYLLQPQILLSNSMLSVTLETNPTPPSAVISLCHSVLSPENYAAIHLC